MKHEITSDYDLTLKTVELVNFMAYKNTKLDFSGKDIVGILAQYAKDKSRSNRAGKTVLLEAIRYNLTGKHRAKTDKELIHSGAPFMEAICTYTDGQKDYVIRRGVDEKGKGLLEVDWVTNVREAQDEINALFGITPDDIDLTNFFKQADIMGFMGMKPAEKTNFLMKYIENQHWADKEKLANADRAVVKQKIRDNDNLRSTLERSLEVDISLEGMKADALKEIENEKEQLAELKTKHAQLSGKSKNLADDKKALLVQINKSKSILESLEAELDDVEVQKTKFDKLNSDIKNYETTIKLKEFVTKRTIKQVSDLISIAQSKISLLNVQVASANKNKGTCPIIKKECSSISFTAKQVVDFKLEIETNNLEIEALEAEIERIDGLNELRSSLEKANARLSALNENKKDLDTIKEKIVKENTELKNFRIKFETLKTADYETALYNLDEKISTLSEKVETAQTKINKFDVRIQQSKNAKTKIDKLVSENEILKKELSLLNHTCFMFSKKGIPSGEIENAFGEIEEKINYCLENLNAGLSISFAADKETTEKEPLCSCGHEFEKGFRGKECPECGEARMFKRSSEINFSVVEGDKEQSFDLDSGGGKQLICYAVKIALTYFKRRMNKCKLNMLFLDEIDSALDPYLANQIISSVTNFLTKKLGFKQILMVSHKEQIKDSMPHLIKVVKHDTYSTARFV